MRHLRAIGRLARWAAVLMLLGGPFAATAEPPPDGERNAYVGNETCTGCHEEAVTHDGIHMRIRSFEVQGRTVGCEGCHGPGERHAESGDPALIRRFGEEDGGDEACLACHRTKNLLEWPASAHAAEEVGCTECHAVHTASDPFASCLGCHGDVVASFQLPSRHPLREGKMDCADCHDVHAATEAALRTEHLRPNDLCFDCHQEKEGPFVFEHAPVEESCATCHVPHGSAVDNLLTANEPALCLQCHDFHFHAGYRASEAEEVEIGIPRENAFGPEGFAIAFTTSCTGCHSRVHGSDLPSQSVPGQGQGLTQ